MLLIKVHHFSRSRRVLVSLFVNLQRRKSLESFDYINTMKKLNKFQYVAQYKKQENFLDDPNAPSSRTNVLSLQ